MILHDMFDLIVLLSTHNVKLEVLRFRSILLQEFLFIKKSSTLTLNKVVSLLILNCILPESLRHVKITCLNDFTHLISTHGRIFDLMSQIWRC